MVDRSEMKELIIEAHNEVKQTRDRIKVWKNKVKVLVSEMEADVMALTELLKKIEELSLDEDERDVTPKDPCDLAKAHRELMETFEKVIG